MRRKILGIAAGAAVAVVTFYLMLSAVLSVWGLDVTEWATVAMVAVPTASAVAVCGWIVSRNPSTASPAGLVGLVWGLVVALTGELVVGSLEIAVAGAVVGLVATAWFVDAGRGETASSSDDTALDHTSAG